MRIWNYKLDLRIFITFLFHYWIFPIILYWIFPNHFDFHQSPSIFIKWDLNCFKIFNDDWNLLAGVTVWKNRILSYIEVKKYLYYSPPCFGLQPFLRSQEPSHMLLRMIALLRRLIHGSLKTLPKCIIIIKGTLSPFEHVSCICQVDCGFEILFKWNQVRSRGVQHRAVACGNAKAFVRKKKEKKRKESWNRGSFVGIVFAWCTSTCIKCKDIKPCVPRSFSLLQKLHQILSLCFHLGTRQAHCFIDRQYCGT